MIINVFMSDEANLNSIFDHCHCQIDFDECIILKNSSNLRFKH